MLRIRITPARGRNGERHPNRLTATLDESGEVLCSTETPLLDAARVLLTSGKAGENDVIVMRHSGSDHDAMRAKVGVAAGLMRAEPDRGRIRIMKVTNFRVIWAQD